MSKAFSNAGPELLHCQGTPALRRGCTKEGWELTLPVGCGAKSSSMVWQRMETHLQEYEGFMAIYTKSLLRLNLLA